MASLLLCQAIIVLEQARTTALRGHHRESSMRSSRIPAVAALIAVCLTGAIQARTFVGSLSLAEGQLAEQDGQVVIVRRRVANAAPVEGALRIWTVSAPYLHTGKGQYLAAEELADSVRIRLTDKKDKTANWSIEVLETASPQHPTTGSRGERHLLVGESRTKFRLLLTEGRFKGWYLAAQEPTEEQAAAALNQPIVLDFRVVQSPKQAIVFDYVDTKYAIDHK